MASLPDGEDAVPCLVVASELQEEDVVVVLQEQEERLTACQDVLPREEEVVVVAAVEGFPPSQKDQSTSLFAEERKHLVRMKDNRNSSLAPPLSLL